MDLCPASTDRIKADVALKKLLAFLKQLHMRPVYFAVPVALSMASSLFEGMSLGLLVPFLKGALQLNFSFARDFPVLRNILDWLPHNLANRNIALFAIFVVIIFVAAILKNVFWYLGQVGASWQIRKFIHELRCLLFKRYLNFGKLFFDRESVAHVTQVIEGDTAALSVALVQSNSVLNYLLMIFVYLGMMFYLSWQMTLFVLLVFPAFNGTIQWLVHKIKRASESQIQLKTLLNKKMYAIISCITLVKANSREEEENRNYRCLSQKVQGVDYNLSIKQVLIPPLMEILMLLMILILISGMTYLVVHRIGQIESSLVFFFVLKRALTAAGNISNIQGCLAGLVGPLREIKEVLDDRGKFFVPEGTQVFEGLKSGIEFKNLDFSYSKDLPGQIKHHPKIHEDH